jgi:sulfotransferase family protein
MLYHMLVSSGLFPVYRSEPVVFDLLVPRFGDLHRKANRRRLMKCWLRSRQFRRSGLDAARIEQKVLNSVTNGGEFLSAVMDEVAAAGAFARWTVYGADNLLYIPTIKRQIPNALFIHVIRDGRDVACSLERKGFIRPFPWDRNEGLLVSALHWMWRVRTGRHYGMELNRDYLEIKYEDLVLGPSEALARVSTFIGQELDYKTICRAEIGTLREPNTSFTEELQSGEFSPVGRWARHLTGGQVLELENLIGEALIEVDYPLFCCSRGNVAVRLKVMRAFYPMFYDMKQWLKTRTALGRFVNMSRLCLDKTNASVEAREDFRIDRSLQPNHVQSSSPAR